MSEKESPQDVIMNVKTAMECIEALEWCGGNLQIVLDHIHYDKYFELDKAKTIITNIKNSILNMGVLDDEV